MRHAAHILKIVSQSIGAAKREDIYSSATKLRQQKNISLYYWIKTHIQLKSAQVLICY